MALDAPTTGTVSAAFPLFGWALESAAPSGTGIDAVHVWAYPTDGGAPIFAGAATLGVKRDDVAAILGTQFATAGYNLTVTSLPPGSYTLVVSAHSALTGTFDQSRSVSVTVPPAAPAMSVDAPASASVVDRLFSVSGWAVDRAASNGPGVDAVHVWAFPTDGSPAIFVGQASYGAIRDDVGAVFGGPFSASGFSLAVSILAPGTYDLGIYAHSTVSNGFNQYRVIRVTVKP
jgi:hypothetical protein